MFMWLMVEEYLDRRQHGHARFPCLVWLAALACNVMTSFHVLAVSVVFFSVFDRVRSGWTVELMLATPPIGRSQRGRGRPIRLA